MLQIIILVGGEIIMLNKLVSRLITKIKHEPYSLDSNISTIDIFLILSEKSLQVLRGFLKGFLFGKHKGIIFIGKRVKIRHSKHIKVKNGLTIGDNCQINSLSKGGIEFGHNVSLGSGTIIECTGVIRELGESLVIGNRVGFAQNCFIEVRGSITIGDDCIFGPGVSLAAENHNFNDLKTPIRLQGATRKGINIGSDCWIGTKASILDGVTIGKGCVIAAGAVVNKNIPDYSVVGGIPAKIIKLRGDIELLSSYKEEQ